MSNFDKKERLWEVDFLRGLAVVMMLISNFVFDLSFFSYIQISKTGVWPWFAKITAGLFLIIVGISLSISFARPAARLTGFNKVVKRGAKIFGLGLIISFATWWAVGDEFVMFGILHLIGSGVILAYPFLTRPNLSLLTGLVVIAGGVMVTTVSVSFPWLLWLGLKYDGFASVDYTPLFPWFGFILLGIYLGSSCFPKGKRRVILLSSGDSCPIRFIRKMGTKSLIIYFVHQPILWAGFLGLRWLTGVT